MGGRSATLPTPFSTRRLLLSAVGCCFSGPTAAPPRGLGEACRLTRVPTRVCCVSAGDSRVLSHVHCLPVVAEGLCSVSRGLRTPEGVGAPAWPGRGLRAASSCSGPWGHPSPCASVTCAGSRTQQASPAARGGGGDGAPRGSCPRRRPPRFLGLPGHWRLPAWGPGAVRPAAGPRPSVRAAGQRSVGPSPGCRVCRAERSGLPAAGPLSGVPLSGDVGDTQAVGREISETKRQPSQIANRKCPFGSGQ